MTNDEAFCLSADFGIRASPFFRYSAFGVSLWLGAWHFHGACPESFPGWSLVLGIFLEFGVWSLEFLQRLLPQRLLLTSDAIQLVPRANEKLALGNGDRGAELIVVVIAHRSAGHKFELLRGSDDKDLASEVLEIDFVVGAGGGGFDFSASAQRANPFGFAGGGFDAGDGLAFAV